MNQQTAYKWTDHELATQDGEQTYTITRFRDLPDEVKPRERLIAHGPDTLELSDLLAIVLQMGTTKENVMKMSRRILRQYGERGILSEKNPKTLSKELGLPLTKACQVVACLELGRRLFDTKKAGPVLLQTPQQVYVYAKDMGHAPKEQLRGLYLNSRHRLVHDEIISVGTLTSNLIHPREVFRPALEHSAAALILVHNHPSGSSKPSRADIEVTQTLVEAGKLMGIDLLDHLIITKRGFSSIPCSYSTD